MPTTGDTPATAAAGLLGGLTVLDLTWGLGGPLAGMLLADHGAEVIKVEPPGGDPYRFVPAFQAWNRGKRSVVIDLKTAQGRDDLLALCARADILLEAFRPGVAERLGLDFETLQARFPRLIHASISAYAQGSARRDEPGHEALVAAWFGLPSAQQGWRPGPRFNAFPIASYGSAMLTLVGVLAALRARAVTGRGQRVGTSMEEGLFAMASMNANWSEHGPARTEQLDVAPTLPRRFLLNMGVLECSDGRFLQIHSGAFGRFAAALQVMGLLDQVTPAAPAVEKSAPLTEAERTLLLREIPRIIKTRPRDEWMAAFLAQDVACMPVSPPGEAFGDPQVVHDGSIVTVDDPELGPVQMLGPTLKCPQAPPRRPRPAPRLGEHSEAVLRAARAAAAVTAHAPAPPSGAPLRHPLQGIRIVDLGSFYAGPAASRILADLGAEVIKVEPLQGDALRPTVMAFCAAQRGKRSIAVDMKTPEGKAIVMDLVARADVVTHNMRPEVAKRLGLGFDELSRLRPGLVYLYSPGFGSTGPRADEPAFAPLVSAMCGLTWQSAGRGNPPIQWWVSNEDQLNGFLGAIALLMGLHWRGRSGESVYLEGSLLNAALFAAQEVLMRPDGTPVFRFEIDPDQLGFEPLCRLYRSTDGWVMLVAVLPREWQALQAWFAARSNAQALAALKQAGVPCEVPRPSQSSAYFLDPDHLRQGRVVEYVYPVVGRMREQGHAIHFSATPGLIRGPAPTLGQHTREILAELGHAPERIAALQAAKVIA